MNKSDKKIVKITWIDSSEMPGWVDIDDFKPNMETVESIGFVVAETDDFICISNSLCNNHVNSPLTVQKIAIKEINYV